MNTFYVHDITYTNSQAIRSNFILNILLIQLEKVNYDKKIDL